jgi:hypothetical protein
MVSKPNFPILHGTGRKIEGKNELEFAALGRMCFESVWVVMWSI